MKPVIHMLILMVVLSFGERAQANQLLTGSVESSQTQDVVMPMVRSFQGKISEMAEEGSFVQPGDFLVRIDGSELDSTIESKIEQLDVFKASSERDMIQIEIDTNNAKLALEQAKVAEKVAQLKAAVPVNFIGELEFKERQLTLKKATKTLSEAENEWQATVAKKKEKELEIVMGTQQKEKDLAHWQGRLDGLTIHAEQAGFVIYSSHPWTGSKYQIGDQVNTGMSILKVSKREQMKVTAWVNAIDLPQVALNQTVQVAFDALPDVVIKGRVQEISSGGQDKKDWGDGLYYEVEVSLDGADDVPLLPGMSALVMLSEV